MRGIAKLLLGDEAGRLLGLFGEGDDDESGLAEQARRAGEWCGTTPGAGAAADAVRGVHRARRVPRPVSRPEFRPR
jgi:hypothetical protein